MGISGLGTKGQKCQRNLEQNNKNIFDKGAAVCDSLTLKSAIKLVMILALQQRSN